MAQIKAKLIEYAYPTSTTAAKHGFYDTGCWFVAMYPSIEASQGGKIDRCFELKKDAEEYAESLPNPYNWMHKYHNK